VTNTADEEVVSGQVEVAGQYLDFPGGRVHLLRGGDGPPLLFLHAAGGAGQWHEFLERLAATFTVYAPDHPGFGKSDELAEVEDIGDLVYHYLDVIDRLGLERPHVVGGSFGGWIAAEIAVAAPHKIGSLALLGAAGLRLPGHPVADLFLMSPPELGATLFHDPAKAAAFAPAEVDLDFILAAYRDASALARFCWSPFLSNPKLERRLHRITAPTLVAWGDDDRLIPVEHGRRYAGLIPGATLTVVPGCGHAMYFERPAEFARAVADFLTTGAKPQEAGR
jgi:pimeloyl-ACP methyl ester carboxylesterase